jgi:Flp pilus assembly protein TadD
MYLTWFAATQGACGALGDALRTLDTALSVNPHELFFRPESLRVRGELLLRAGERDAAADDLRQAADLAATIKAALFQQRAAESLRQLRASGM